MAPLNSKKKGARDSSAALAAAAPFPGKRLRVTVYTRHAPNANRLHRIKRHFSSLALSALFPPFLSSFHALESSRADLSFSRTTCQLNLRYFTPGHARVREGGCLRTT